MSCIHCSPPVVDKPKRKITKTVVRWANIYENGDMTYWENEQSAKKAGSNARVAFVESGVNGRIACVKLSGIYEVDE